MPDEQEEMISTVQDAEITLLKSGELTLVYAHTHTHTHVRLVYYLCEVSPTV